MSLVFYKGPLTSFIVVMLLCQLLGLPASPWRVVSWPVPPAILIKVWHGIDSDQIKSRFAGSSMIPEIIVTIIEG